MASVADLRHDLAFTLRTLFRNPGFTITVLLTLALGIGVCSAVFSMNSALLMRPLPFAKPDQLVQIFGVDKAQGWNRLYISPLDLQDLRESAPAFQKIEGFYVRELNLSGSENEPEPVNGARVTAGVFSALGVSPALGRGFEPQDEAGTPVAVISHGLWQRRFGGDPQILGRKILVHSQACSVIGVMPQDFSFPNPTTAVWLPAEQAPQQMTRGNKLFSVLGRLADGASQAEARAQLATLAGNLVKDHPDSHRDFGFDLVPLRRSLVFAYDRIVLVSRILIAAVAFTLILVCANVANLLLARFSGRSHELIIRNALGAGSGRLVRLFLTESLVLSLVGGALGLLFAKWLMRLGAPMIPDNVYRVGEFELTGGTVAFTFGLALLTALLVGLMPARHAVRTQLATAIAEAKGGSRRGRRFFDALVVTQLAIGTILLIGALLMLRSVDKLGKVDPGFDTGVLSVRLNLPLSDYPDPVAQATFVENARERIGRIPGVKNAAAVNFLPLNNETLWRSLKVEGQDYGENKKPAAIMLFASAGYFETMDVPLMRGRRFDATDLRDSAPVAVVNATFAARYLPKDDPTAARIAVENANGEVIWRSVVGVVGDYSHVDLKSAARPQVFIPYAQSPWAYFRLLVSAEVPPLSLLAPIRGALAELNPNLPLQEPQLLQQVIAESLVVEKFTSSALVALGIGALLLAMIGLYGVMAYRVARSVPEIGIRMALGADRREIRRQVLRQAFRLTILGLAIGLVAAAGISFGLSRLLFGIEPVDILTYAAVGTVLALVAIVAGYLPAVRASRISPMEALRQL